MTKSETTDVSVKVRRRPRFKAGSDLSGKVNKVGIDINQTVEEDSDAECLDIVVKWETDAELMDISKS
ncbi:hypothetical protein GCM10009118_16030 [Wandonia haliotis]|uniref:Uncharacterized protein n=1 Tax=Wandonia haliotis TaxID=574963 RepID=A0ABN1MQ55_9FLAO